MGRSKSEKRKKQLAQKKARKQANLSVTGKSKYAQKQAKARRGIFSPRSPFRSVSK